MTCARSLFFPVCTLGRQTEWSRAAWHANSGIEAAVLRLADGSKISYSGKLKERGKNAVLNWRFDDVRAGQRLVCGCMGGLQLWRTSDPWPDCEQFLERDTRLFYI